MVSLANSTKYLKQKNDINLIKMLSANRRGGNIYNVILIRKTEKDIKDKNKNT